MCTGLEVALIAAAGVGAAGTLYAGEQQMQAAKYNAQVAEASARAAQEKAAYDEQIHRERVRKTLSTIRSLYGAAGVDMTGTPLLAMEESAAQGEMDALAIRYGGDVEAARQRSAATLSRRQGRAAQAGSYFQAGSTLLSGAASYGSAQTALAAKSVAPTGGNYFSVNPALKP